MKKRGIVFLLLTIALLIITPNINVYAAEYTVTSVSAIGTAVAETPVLAEPDETTTILATFPIGTPFTISGVTSNGWYQLDIAGGTFYTPQGFLSVDGTSTTNTQTNTYTSPVLQETISYSFSTSDEAKADLADALLKHASKITFTSNNQQALDSLYAYVGNFLRSNDVKSYAEGNMFGYQMGYGGYYNSNGYNGTIDLNITYGDSIQEEAYVEAAVAAMVPQMQAQGSVYNQVKAVHDFICNNANYDFSMTPSMTGRGYEYNSAYDCLATKKAVCSGYALLFQKFMEQLGIPAYYIANDSHAWNIVYVDGAWYQMDCTWDGQNQETIYNYFLFGQDGEHPYAGSVAISSTRHQ